MKKYVWAEKTIMVRAGAFLLFALLLIGMLSAAALAQKTGVPSGYASEEALYAHAVSYSEDGGAWLKWQSAHTEDFQEENPQI